MNSQQPGGAFAGYQYAEDASGKVTYMSPAQLQAKETGWGIRQGDAATGAAEFTLQREKEKWDLEKKSAAATQKLTEQFLSQWGVGMDTIKGIYEGILGTGGTTKEGAGGAFGGLNDLVSKITGEYDEFKKTYSSLEEAGIESAREDLGMRREALGNLQDLSKADYKGVAGRAMTDVAVQSNAAREAEARNAMSLGIDPSSGKFGAL
ncbi:hypothetical protein KKE60_04230, partial [Patescibacteria group bacterium]|nr:hypothetical protein [Patescibacteria group bacterium]